MGRLQRVAEPYEAGEVWEAPMDFLALGQWRTCEWIWCMNLSGRRRGKLQRLFGRSDWPGDRPWAGDPRRSAGLN